MNEGLGNPHDNIDSEQTTPAPTGIKKLNSDAPITWLKKGWRDLLNTRFQGCFYGLLFMAMGFAIAWIYAARWQLTTGLIAGFFLMAPFLCVGIYDLSRQYENNGKSSFLKSLTCWSRNTGSIALFAFILTFVMIVWARVSLILFALVSTTSFPTLQGILGAIFSFQNAQFLLTWCGIGFIFASVVFAISVVSVPMLLDRKSDTITAIFSSLRSVQTNPKVLYMWAFIVVVVIGLSLLLGFIPLVLTAPVIGHATWHAYRDLVQHETA